MSKRNVDAILGFGASGKTKMYGPIGTGEYSAPHIELGNKSVREYIKKHPGVDPMNAYTLSIAPRVPGELKTTSGETADLSEHYKKVDKQNNPPVGPSQNNPQKK